MKYKAFLRLRVDKISVHKWTKSPFIGGQNLRWVDKISPGWTALFLCLLFGFIYKPPLGVQGSRGSPLQACGGDTAHCLPLAF